MVAVSAVSLAATPAMRLDIRTAVRIPERRVRFNVWPSRFGDTPAYEDHANRCEAY